MIGETIGGRYHLVAHLGTGGMGAVYEARHTGTGRRVAVKLITEGGARSKDRIRRFKVEARAAGVIESEHIAQVFDLDEDAERGVPFLAMELLEGEDLKRLIRRLGRLPTDLALRITLQASRALAKAHQQHIIHRDIKPANIFVTEREGGRRLVKLLDFGIAKFRRDEHALGPFAEGNDSGITATGTMMGTPTYMSPEQTNGLKKTDHRTDVWAIGVVLYEMLCGRAPHADAEGMGDLMIRICRHPVHIAVDAPFVPPAVAAIVDRALTIDIEKRWQSCDDLVSALEALLPNGADIDAGMLVPASDSATSAVASTTATTAPGSGTDPTRLAAEVEVAHATTVGVTNSIPAPPPAPKRSAVTIAVALAFVGLAGLGVAVVALGETTRDGANARVAASHAPAVEGETLGASAQRDATSTPTAGEPVAEATALAPAASSAAASAVASAGASTSAAANTSGAAAVGVPSLPATRPGQQASAGAAPPGTTTSTAVAPPVTTAPKTGSTAAKPGPTMKDKFE